MRGIGVFPSAKTLKTHHTEVFGDKQMRLNLTHRALLKRLSGGPRTMIDLTHGYTDNNSVSFTIKDTYLNLRGLGMSSTTIKSGI